MNTGKGLAIAAFVFAIIGALTPAIGLLIGWAALLMATASAYFGERPLTIATVAISALAFLFLTPSLWIEAAGAAQLGLPEDTAVGGQPPVLRYISMAALAAPVVTMFLSKNSAPPAD